MAGGRQLNKDLEELKKRYGAQYDSILMELHFPDDYPAAPFFARVVRPWMVMYTGHVTAGGSICIEALTLSGTEKGWQPSLCVESVLTEILANMVDAEVAYVQTNTGPGGVSGPLRIDMNRHPSTEYSMAEARQAFERLRRNHGWGGKPAHGVRRGAGARAHPLPAPSPRVKGVSAAAAPPGPSAAATAATPAAPPSAAAAAVGQLGRKQARDSQDSLAPAVKRPRSQGAGASGGAAVGVMDLTGDSDGDEDLSRALKLSLQEAQGRAGAGSAAGSGAASQEDRDLQHALALSLREAQAGPSSPSHRQQQQQRDQQQQQEQRGQEAVHVGGHQRRLAPSAPSDIVDLTDEGAFSSFMTPRGRGGGQHGAGGSAGGAGWPRQHQREQQREQQAQREAQRQREAHELQLMEAQREKEELERKVKLLERGLLQPPAHWRVGPATEHGEVEYIEIYRQEGQQDSHPGAKQHVVVEPSEDDILELVANGVGRVEAIRALKKAKGDVGRALMLMLEGGVGEDPEGAAVDEGGYQSKYGSAAISELVHLNGLSPAEADVAMDQAGGSASRALDWATEFIQARGRPALRSMAQQKLRERDQEGAKMKQEAQEVISKFMATLGTAPGTPCSGQSSRVVSIERVQNLKLWSKYQMRLAEVREETGGAPNEQMLWHGTAQKNIPVITQKGFDIREANMGGALGVGAYFAARSSYSKKYSGGVGWQGTAANPGQHGGARGFWPQGQKQKAGKKPLGHAAAVPPAVGPATAGVQPCFLPGTLSMMLCHVALGTSVHGAPGMRKTPEGTHSSSGAGEIFAVFDNTQAYPAYIVHYC